MSPLLVLLEVHKTQKQINSMASSADLSFTTLGKKELSEQKKAISSFLVWEDIHNILEMSYFLYI